MGLHVYCVVPPDRAPGADLRGVDDAAVRGLDAGAVRLWVSQHERRPAASTDAARGHNRVIEAAMDRVVTPVPARFGQWFDDDDAAAEHVAGEAEHWLSLLRQFAGHAEYGIRITGVLTGGASARELRPAATGTAYMAELARREAESQSRERELADLAGSFAHRLTGLAADSRVEAGSDGSVGMAHLVAWNRAAEYHSAVRELGAELAAESLLFTGPWPPWTFVQ